MGLYVIDRDKQVAYWQLISVVENRPQREETAAALGVVTYVLQQPHALGREIAL